MGAAIWRPAAVRRGGVTAVTLDGFDIWQMLDKKGKKYVGVEKRKESTVRKVAGGVGCKTASGRYRVCP